MIVAQSYQATGFIERCGGSPVTVGHNPGSRLTEPKYLEAIGNALVAATSGVADISPHVGPLTGTGKGSAVNTGPQPVTILSNGVGKPCGVKPIFQLAAAQNIRTIGRLTNYGYTSIGSNHPKHFGGGTAAGAVFNDGIRDHQHGGIIAVFQIIQRTLVQGNSVAVNIQVMEQGSTRVNFAGIIVNAEDIEITADTYLIG